jgi:hypothetical protein
MPAPTPSRLSLLTFPQRWSDGTIQVRFLCLPKGDPTATPAAGQPSFSTANLVFIARLIDNLDNLPRAADAVPAGPLVLDREPVQKALLLSALTQKFNVVSRPVAVPPAALSFRKPVTESYRALTGNRELSKFKTRMTSSVRCTMPKRANRLCPCNSTTPSHGDGSSLWF